MTYVRTPEGCEVDFLARDATARQHGVSADAYTVQLLDRHLPCGSDAAELVSLLQSWMDEEDAGEQRDTGEYLVRALDGDRLSDRRFFPQKHKGFTW